MIYDGYLFYTFGDIFGNIFRANWLLFLVWEYWMGFSKTCAVASNGMYFIFAFCADIVILAWTA